MRDAEAWPDIAVLLTRAEGRAKVIAPEASRGARAAALLGVTRRSNQYALCVCTGGVVVDDWIVLLGGGSAGVRGDLASWNGLGPEAVSPRIVDRFVVAYDRIGGLFALDPSKSLLYFAPDALAWEALVEKGGHFALLDWALSDPDRVRDFYADARWPGWEAEAAACGFDDAIQLYPPPWSAEGGDRTKVSRAIAPAHEVVGLLLHTASRAQAE